MTLSGDLPAQMPITAGGAELHQPLPMTKVNHGFDEPLDRCPRLFCGQPIVTGDSSWPSDTAHPAFPPKTTPKLARDAEALEDELRKTPSTRSAITWLRRRRTGRDGAGVTGGPRLNEMARPPGFCMPAPDGRRFSNVAPT
jgi:hypothetical protein